LGARGLYVRPEDLANEDERSKITICVVGLDRVGLSMACLWARAGFSVLGADINPIVVSAVASGQPPLEEPGLKEALASATASGRLRATTEVREAAARADLVDITTSAQVDELRRPDYAPVVRACREVGLGLREGTLVLLEGALAPGTTEELLKPVLEEASGLKVGQDLGLAYSPARARSGSVLRDLASRPRALGAYDSGSLRAARAFLATTTRGGVITVSSIREAEAVRLFEDLACLAEMALANELAMFCYKAGLNLAEIARAAGLGPLRPGLAGGQQLVSQALILAKAEELGLKLKLVKAAQAVNDMVVKHALRLLRDALRELGLSMRRSVVAVLGVSNRPDVKDPEGSRSADLVKALMGRCREVRAYDPYFRSSELKALGYPASNTLVEAVEGANCLLIATGHTKFKELPLEGIRSHMAERAAIVDLAGVVEPSRAIRAGFTYRSLGQGKAGD